MSRHIAVQSSEVLGIELATQRLASLDKGQPDFLPQACGVLAGLYNNRGLLDQVLQAALLQATAGTTAFYSPQSFLLATGRFACGAKTFTLRGNIWFPAALAGLNQRMEDSVYSYNNCHDHNFDFLTIGYSGSGYETDIYEYDREQVHGRVDEPVALRFVERAQLAQGRILHFRKCRDVHVQLYPSTTSISLNILMPDEDLSVLPQYEFNAAKGRISEVLYSSSMVDCSLAYLLGQLGCRDAIPVMAASMLASPMRQHREAAHQAREDAGVMD